MKKCIITGVVLAAVFAGVAAAALPGHRVAIKSASGQFAVTAVQATVKHPHAVYLRLVGGIDSGTIVIACSRGYATISSKLVGTQPRGALPRADPARARRLLPVDRECRWKRADHGRAEGVMSGTRRGR
jgi:uncharacterized NAD-dependent epimerase/dehydratase family protein